MGAQCVCREVIYTRSTETFLEIFAIKPVSKIIPWEIQDLKPQDPICILPSRRDGDISL